MSRRLLAALSVTLAGLGLLARSGSVLPPDTAVTLAVVGRATTPTVAAVLVLGTALGAAVLVRGRLDTDDSAPVTAFRPERRVTTDLPLLGADVATALDRIATDGAGADPADRETVRAAVERTGVTVLARAEEIDREAARRRFRRGEWTRDPAVAAFCGAAVEVPLRTRLRELLASDPRFVQRTHRTVAALAAVADGTAASTGARSTRGGRGAPGRGPASPRRGGERR